MKEELKHSQSRLHQPRGAAPTSRHQGIVMRITALLCPAAGLCRASPPAPSLPCWVQQRRSDPAVTLGKLPEGHQGGKRTDPAAPGLPFSVVCPQGGISGPATSSPARTVPSAASPVAPGSALPAGLSSQPGSCSPSKRSAELSFLLSLFHFPLNCQPLLPSL